jgi:hypothetical protein
VIEGSGKPGYGATPDEYGVLLRPKRKLADRPAALFYHMFGSNARIVHDVLYGPPAYWITKSGMIVFSGDFGGPNSWGNGAARAASESGLDEIQFNGSGGGHKPATFSYSMGTYPSLGLLRKYRYMISAAVLALPAPISLQKCHDSFPSLAAAIELAFGGTEGYEDALPEYDPVNWIEELDGLPILVPIDVNDPFYLGVGSVPAGYPELFDGVSTAEPHFFNGGGHTLDGLDPKIPAQWLKERITYAPENHLWLNNDLYLEDDLYAVR